MPHCIRLAEHEIASFFHEDDAAMQREYLRDILRKKGSEFKIEVLNKL